MAKHRPHKPKSIGSIPFSPTIKGYCAPPCFLPMSTVRMAGAVLTIKYCMNMRIGDWGINLPLFWRKITYKIVYFVAGFAIMLLLSLCTDIITAFCLSIVIETIRALYVMMSNYRFSIWNTVLSFVGTVISGLLIVIL